MLNSLGKNFSRLVEETEDIIVHHSVTEDEYIATGISVVLSQGTARKIQVAFI